MENGATILQVNIWNEYKMLQNQSKILITLRTLELKDPELTGFSEIQIRTRVSSRTLSKHLKTLIGLGVIQKQGRSHRLTSMGITYMEQLPSQLKEFRRYEQMSPSTNEENLMRDSAMEVTKTSTSETCVGIIRYSVSRGEKFIERSSLDRILTEFMRIIMKGMPSVCREYEVTITGIKKSKVN
jgi:DNA-binding HxlR family transcriptional regulator